MANSAEHAYREGEAGPIDVRAEELNGRLTVTVTDYGTWQPPVPTNGLRGRGLLLIDSLADHSAKVHREDGTTVTMTWLRNGAAASSRRPERTRRAVNDPSASASAQRDLPLPGGTFEPGAA